MTTAVVAGPLAVRCSGAVGFPSLVRLRYAMEESMQKHTHRNTVPRTSEGLLDMVNGGGGGGVAGSICYVGVVGSLLPAETSQLCLLLSGCEWQTLCHARLGRGLACGEVK